MNKLLILCILTLTGCMHQESKPINATYVPLNAQGLETAVVASNSEDVFMVIGFDTNNACELSISLASRTNRTDKALAPIKNMDMHINAKDFVWTVATTNYFIADNYAFLMLDTSETPDELLTDIHDADTVAFSVKNSTAQVFKMQSVRKYIHRAKNACSKTSTTTPLHKQYNNTRYSI